MGGVNARDAEASDPFTPNPGQELERVLKACDEDRRDWLGPSADFLAYTGAHISVLSGGWRHQGDDTWYQPPLRSESVRGEFIYWRRPKNEKQIGMPLSRHLKGWLPEWLDRRRPLDRTTYNKALNEVGSLISLQVNPLRFRHTCAVLLYHVHHLDGKSIERLLGVTPETLTTYVMKPKWMVAQELAASGW